MSETKDSNGNELNNGDSVQLTQDLKPSGFPQKLKRGEVIKNIKIYDDDPSIVDCKIGKSTLVIKTCYLKKR